MIEKCVHIYIVGCERFFVIKDKIILIPISSFKSEILLLLNKIRPWETDKSFGAGSGEVNNPKVEYCLD